MVDYAKMFEMSGHRQLRGGQGKLPEPHVVLTNRGASQSFKMNFVATCDVTKAIAYNSNVNCLAYRINGRAYTKLTMLRLSVTLSSVTHVLWLNGA